MCNLKQFFVFFFLLIGTQMSFSQALFSHELGAVVGPVQFRSDFGEREDASTNLGNSGFGVGFVYYMNFAFGAGRTYRIPDWYIFDHVQFRADVSYNQTKLEHFGVWTEGDSQNAAKLRTHTGEARNVDLGFQFEYFPLSIRDFESSFFKFSPYVGLGVHYTFYSPEAYTDYVNPATGIADGNINNANNFWSAWDAGSIDPSQGSTWSLVTSAGVRYKLTPFSDLLLDLRWQYFGSDWLDGLNHQLP
jgi:hypothetical protein